MTQNYEAAHTYMGSLLENARNNGLHVTQRLLESVQDALRLAAAVERGEYVKLADAPKDDTQPDAKWLIERQGVGEYSVTKYVPAPQWRPIESCPYGLPVTVGRATGIRDVMSGVVRCDANLFMSGPTGFVNPTHWMPLPTPPTERTER